MFSRCYRRDGWHQGYLSSKVMQWAVSFGRSACSRLVGRERMVGGGRWGKSERIRHGVRE